MIGSVHGGNGLRSFYGVRKIARRERSGTTALTAAHRTLHFGPYVLVTNVSNGKTVVVCVTDRGPYRRGRIIDVSRAAARKLDMIDRGTTLVSVVLR